MRGRKKKGGSGCIIFRGKNLTARSGRNSRIKSHRKVILLFFYHLQRHYNYFTTVIDLRRLTVRREFDLYSAISFSFFNSAIEKKEKGTLVSGMVHGEFFWYRSNRREHGFFNYYCSCWCNVVSFISCRHVRYYVSVLN